MFSKVNMCKSIISPMKALPAMVICPLLLGAPLSKSTKLVEPVAKNITIKVPNPTQYEALKDGTVYVANFAPQTILKKSSTMLADNIKR